MIPLAPARVGWCPGVLRPMATGDGLVLRVKPRGGVLTFEQAAMLGELAGQYGDGHIDLTSRANLQIRGLSDGSAKLIVAALRDVNLVDEGPEAEAVRNIVASPLAGLDPQAALDIRPVVAAIEAMLLSRDALASLPAKWSIVVDHGGDLSLCGVPADLRFEAGHDGAVRIGLADDPLRARCDPRDAADIGAELCAVALRPEPRRMGAIVRDHGAAAIFARLGLDICEEAGSAVEPTHAQIVGVRALGPRWRLGAAAAFGRVTSKQLSALVTLARRARVSDIRVTPWRALLLAGVSEAEARPLGREAAQLGWIVDPDDPRLGFAACPGAPACHRATTPVRAHAEELASRLDLGGMRDPVAVHVSGCAKGCAHARSAAWTLVGRDGLYDVVQNGRCDAVPVARALTFQDAATWLSRAGSMGRT